jgi:outer membrane protein W
MSRLVGTLSVLAVILTPVTAAADEQPQQADRPATDHAVAGRHRIAVRFGAWRLTADPVGDQSVVVLGTSDLFVGLQYARFLREDLALTVGVDALPADTGLAVGSGGLSVGSRTIVALALGFQWNPRGEDAAASIVKPYVGAGVGPVIGSGGGVRIGSGGASLGLGTQGTIGGHVRGGVDVHLARSWSLGGGVGYNWMSGFSEPLGERDNYGGIDVQLTLGWLFGRGRGE